jgi:hypothetical protein
MFREWPTHPPGWLTAIEGCCRLWFVYVPFITEAKIRNGFFMCSEARMFNPYQFNLDGLADDTRFDPYHCPGVHLSGSNVLLTSTILLFAIRARSFDAAGDHS